MLQVDTRRIETKTAFKIFGKRPVALIGLILKHLSGAAFVRSSRDSEPRLHQLSVKMFLLFFPKDVSEYMLGDLQEEYADISEKFGTRRAKIWFYKQLVTSIPHLLWHRLKVIGFHILINPNRKDA